MSSANYQQLTEVELRNYIKHHPEDEETFQYYLTVVRAKPNRVVVSTPQQLEMELKKRLNP